MKNSKLTLSIMASLVTSLALVGCNETVTKGKSGYILTLTNSAGEKVNVTADEIFGEYYNETSGVKKMFDSVYELYVRNYWTNPSYSEKLKEIQKKAKNKVQADKDTANENKKANGTTYDEELKEILDSKGVENVKELYNYYEYQLMQEEFEDRFYDDNLLALRDGFTVGTTTKDGYLKEKIPYHVKHVLVNVDASGSALYNGEISEANARKLGKVVEMFAKEAGTNGSYNFGTVAFEESDDKTSAEKYGDLGIMDKDTSFVNEFKLGVYAFDTIYNKETAAKKDLIGMPAEQETYFSTDADAVIGQIPYGVFEELIKVADVTTDANNYKVNDGRAFFYPRNIYFNKYLNNHRISVIVPNDLPTADELYQYDENTGKIKEGSTEAYVGAYNSEYAALPGFASKKDELNIDFAQYGNTDGKVLCDETGKVILVVRAGSSYQGVHFIVVERSALQETVTKIVGGVEEEISLSNYYTPYYPSQTNLYPTYSNGKPMDTFVNTLNMTTKDYKERAESVESAIKGYESNLNTYIYEKLEAEQSLVFHEGEGVKVQEAIKKYIKSLRESADFNANLTWEQTWQTYMEYIQNQTAQRNSGKLLSATCAIGYQNDHENAAWKKGGMCGYDDGK